MRVWPISQHPVDTEHETGDGCLLGLNWFIFIKWSEVLGDSPALTCLIFFPNMEALVSMTNTTFLGTTGRSLGAK